MKARILLRVAAVLIFLFGVGHSLGYPWVGRASPELLAKLGEIRAMTTVTQGFARSYWDYHVGFGLYIGLTLFALAILVWRVSSLATTEPRTARFAAALLALLYAADVVLNFRYFFWLPIIFSAVLAACLALAAVALPARAGATAAPAG